MVHWSRQNVLSLIKDYSKNKLLWDWCDEKYNNRAEREKTLEKLAIKYDTDVPSLKAKLNTLRSSFFQENKRIKRMVAAKMSYKPWYAYKYLEFLKDYKGRPPYQSMPSPYNNQHSPSPTTSSNVAYNKEPNVNINLTQYDDTVYSVDNNKNDNANHKINNEEHEANCEQNVISCNHYDNNVKEDDDENDGENINDGGGIENRNDAEDATIIPDVPNNAGERQQPSAQEEIKPSHHRNENSSFGKYIGKEIEKLSPSTQMFTKCVIQYTIYEAFSGRLKDTFNANQPSDNK